MSAWQSPAAGLPSEQLALERGSPALPLLCGLAELQAGRVCLGPKLAV